MVKMALLEPALVSVLYFTYRLSAKPRENPVRANLFCTDITHCLEFDKYAIDNIDCIHKKERDSNIGNNQQS